MSPLGVLEPGQTYQEYLDQYFPGVPQPTWTRTDIPDPTAVARYQASGEAGLLPGEMASIQLYEKQEAERQAAAAAAAAEEARIAAQTAGQLMTGQLIANLNEPGRYITTEEGTFLEQSPGAGMLPVSLETGLPITTPAVTPDPYAGVVGIDVPVESFTPWPTGEPQYSIDIGQPTTQTGESGDALGRVIEAGYDIAGMFTGQNEYIFTVPGADWMYVKVGRR